MDAQNNLEKCSYQSCPNRGKTEGPSSLLKCARCKTAIYCSKGCQKKHWGLCHKIYCAPPDVIRHEVPELTLSSVQETISTALLLAILSYWKEENTITAIATSLLFVLTSLWNYGAVKKMRQLYSTGVTSQFAPVEWTVTRKMQSSWLNFTCTACATSNKICTKGSPCTRLMWPFHIIWMRMPWSSTSVKTNASSKVVKSMVEVTACLLPQIMFTWRIQKYAMLKAGVSSLAENSLLRIVKSVVVEAMESKGLAGGLKRVDITISNLVHGTNFVGQVVAMGVWECGD